MCGLIGDFSGVADFMGNDFVSFLIAKMVGFCVAIWRNMVYQMIKIHDLNGILALTICQNYDYKMMKLLGFVGKFG